MSVILKHPRLHLRENKKRVKGKGKDGFERGDNSNTRWFRGKGKCKHTGSGKSKASAYYASCTSIEDYNHDDDTIEPADANQAHNDPVDPRSDDGEEALTMTMMRKMTRFLHKLLWTMSLLWRPLNWLQLHFSLTRGTVILTLK